MRVFHAISTYFRHNDASLSSVGLYLILNVESAAFEEEEKLFGLMIATQSFIEDDVPR